MVKPSKFKKNEYFRGVKHYRVVYDFLCGIKKNVKLLEVGAGDCILKSILPENIIYKSADMFGKPDYRIDLNKEKIPVKDETFDILVCLETLEHVLYVDEIIQELKRVTKKEGIFILSIPNEYNFWLRLNYLFAIKKKQTDSPFEVVSKLQHIHRPRVKDILGLFSKHFKIRRVHYIWQSGLSKKSNFFYLFDKIINFLAQIYPSLFSRIVLVIAKNKE
jgi:SAM-dependent methyltransferase